MMYLKDSLLSAEARLLIYQPEILIHCKLKLFTSPQSEETHAEPISLRAILV